MGELCHTKGESLEIDGKRMRRALLTDLLDFRTVWPYGLGFAHTCRAD